MVEVWKLKGPDPSSFLALLLRSGMQYGVEGVDILPNGLSGESD